MEVYSPAEEMFNRRRRTFGLFAGPALLDAEKKYGKRVGGFDSEAVQALHEHRWPGNVRELEHTVERAVLMAREHVVRAEDLGLRARPAQGAAQLDELTLEEAEKLLIQKALGRYQGNVSRAAEALGLSRSALYRRLQQYGINA